MHQIKSLTSKLAPFFQEGAKIMIWFTLVTVLVIFTIHGLLTISHPYSLDYGEAPLINQAMRLSQGESIYRPSIESPPFTITNYPPIYILSLIPFLEMFDSPFHIGRIISFIATLVSATFLALTIMKLTTNRLAAITTGIFFLSFPYVVEWSGRARIDCLALAFATGAIFVLISWPKSRWALLGGGLLLVAAAFTRQSYALAAPLGAFVWLWTRERRKAFYLAILVAGLGATIFILLNIITRGGFFYNIITANVNEFGWARLRNQLSGLWDNTYIILVLSAIFLFIGWREIKFWPFQASFLIGASISALTIGKIGSNVNYFLELTAALSLIAGALIFWSSKHAWRTFIVLLLLTMQMGMLAQETMNVQVDWILTPRRRDFSALQRLEQVVLDFESPVPGDEYMGMLTMNDRPLYIQPFEVSQMANDGKWDQGPFLRDIQNQVFDGILIHHFGSFPVHKERWTPEMLAAIEENYRPFKTLAGTVVFIPQETTGINRVAAPSQKPSLDAVDLIIGPLQNITISSYWGQADITVNPNHPEQIAVLATQTTKFNCYFEDCKIEVLGFISQDGGETWTKITPFSRPNSIFYNGLVAFDKEDNLYALAIRDNTIVINTTDLEEGYQINPNNAKDVTRAQVIAKPWLRVHPESGQVYVTLDAQESDMLFTTPSLLRSQGSLENWSFTSRADLRVSVDDFYSGRAVWPDDIQVLFGEGSNVSLVWTWGWEPWTWPRTVWMAHSTDGGGTFGVPSPILETWGPINTTSMGGRYAIVYRTGSEDFQKLAVATTTDHGQTWTSTIASGNIPLYFDVEVGPGIGMASDGTIDLVFYGHDPDSLDCVLDIQSWQEVGPWGRIDPCNYNVYYTYSVDENYGFIEPVQLNDKLVQGDSLARVEGSSQVGSHLAVASSNEFAYPVWIGTPSINKTQVYTVQIQR